MSKETAKNIVNEFAADNNRRGVWSHIDKATLAAGLIERIESPNKIDQAGTPLCGPATLTRSLAMNNPDAYAQAAIDLYVTRRAQIGNLKVSPGSELVGAVPERRSHVADWIMLSSIRDSDNWLLSPAGWFGLNIAGISVPSTVENWFRNAGYTQVVNAAAVGHFSEPAPALSHMLKANDYLNAGYNVAVFIDADLLESATQDDSVSLYPDHWVMLNSEIRGTWTPHGTSYCFTVWTWGKIYQIPSNLNKPLGINDFYNKYYGFVAARL